MVDLGGVSMAEVSQGVKDALLDPSLSRAAPPTASNVLATVADVLAHSSGGGSGVDFAGVSSVAGDINVPATAATILIPGTQLMPVLTVSGIVVINYSLSLTSALLSVYDAQTGVRVDGIDHWIFHSSEIQGSGGDRIFALGTSGTLPIFLAAGLHTIQIIARASSQPVTANANATFPANISVIFKTLQGSGGGNGGSALTKVEAETSAAPGTTDTNATLLYALVPGTSIAFNLTETKTVFFDGIASALRNGANRTNVQLGLRVDGVDYHGTAPLVAAASFVDIGLAVSKALDLAPGAHTAQLIYRMIDPTSGSAIIFIDSVRQARLTGIYSAPVFGIGTLVKQEAVGTGGVFSVGAPAFTPIPGTSMLLTLGTTQTVLFSGYASSSYYPPSANRRDTQLGLRITATGPVITDYEGSWDNSSGLGNFAGETVVVTRALTLPAGTYTCELVARAFSFVASIVNDVLRPSVLTAVYTNPQNLEEPLFSKIVSASKVDGHIAISTTVGAWADVPGPMAAATYDLVFTPTHTGKAEVSVSGQIRASAGYVSLGLKVNGVDLLPPGIDPDGETPHGYVTGGLSFTFTDPHNFNMSFTTQIDVIASLPTTVRLRYIDQHLSGAGEKILASAGNPLNMSVKYR